MSSKYLVDIFVQYYLDQLLQVAFDISSSLLCSNVVFVYWAVVHGVDFSSRQFPACVNVYLVTVFSASSALFSDEFLISR